MVSAGLEAAILEEQRMLLDGYATNGAQLSIFHYKGGKIEEIYRAPLKATRSSPFQETHIQDEYYWACIMHDLYGR